LKKQLLLFQLTIFISTIAFNYSKFTTVLKNGVPYLFSSPFPRPMAVLEDFAGAGLSGKSGEALSHSTRPAIYHPSGS
jgi:hypothetical protein